MAIFQAQLIGNGVTLITPVADGDAFEILTTDGAGQLALGAAIAAIPGSIAWTDGAGVTNGVITRDPTFATLGGILLKGGDAADPGEPLELDGTGIIFNASGGIFFIDHEGVGGPDADKEFVLKLGPQQILSDGRAARAVHKAGSIPEFSTESASSATLFNLVGAVETTIVTLNATVNYVEPAAGQISCNLSNTGSQTVRFIIRLRVNGGLLYESDPVPLSNGSWLFQFSDQGEAPFVADGDVVTLTVEADLDSGNRVPQVTGSPVSEITLRQLSAPATGGGGSQATAFYFGT